MLTITASVKLNVFAAVRIMPRFKLPTVDAAEIAELAEELRQHGAMWFRDGLLLKLNRLIEIAEVQNRTLARLDLEAKHPLLSIVPALPFSIPE